MSSQKAMQLIPATNSQHTKCLAGPKAVKALQLQPSNVSAHRTRENTGANCKSDIFRLPIKYQLMNG